MFLSEKGYAENESMSSKPNKRWFRAILAISALTVFGIAVSAFLLVRVYRVLNPYLDVEVCGPLTVTSEWVEITPQAPLDASRQVQYLYLHTVEPFVPDYPSWGIRFPDGSVVVPQVELIDRQGTAHPLKASSFSLLDRSRTDLISGIGFRGPALVRTAPYQRVRIRSDRNLKLSRIIWRNYNQSDRK